MRTLLWGGLAAVVAVLLPIVDSSSTAQAAPSSPAPRVAPAESTSFDALQRLVADPDGPAVIDVAAGVHHGDLVIKRPVVLRGAAGAILEGTGEGTVLTIDASDVVVQDLLVRRSGHRSTTEDAGIKAKGERVRLSGVDVRETLFGIILHECKSCIVERTHVTGEDDNTELRGDGIKLWESHDTVVRDCVVEGSRDLVVWYTKRALLEGNVVKGSRYGSHFMYAHDATVRRSRFDRNVVGVFVMYSQRLRVLENVMAGAHGPAGMGLGFKDSDGVEARGNWLVANTTGIYLDNTPRTAAEPAMLDGNLVALNDVAMRLHTAGEGVHVRGNDFRDNAALVEVDGGGDALAVDVRGNHFSDYEGYDLDHDGVGDVAHTVKTLSSELTEHHPSLRFFHGTAAMTAIDALAHALPVFSAKKLLTDPAPLVLAPRLEVPR